MFHWLKKFLWNSKLQNVCETVLNFACKSRNIDLIKFLISQNKIEIQPKAVFKHIFLNNVFSLK